MSEQTQGQDTGEAPAGYQIVGDDGGTVWLQQEDATLAVRRSFNPRPYLINYGGRGAYLEVKWRLVWLRSEHPEALIETTLIETDERHSIFKAAVSIPGGGSATGWGSETAGDFRDHMEKSETKALGRALAALGYGTQFCHDHEFGAGEDVPPGQMRVVDSPVSHPAGRGDGRQRATREEAPVSGSGWGQGNSGPSKADASPATERQVKFIYAIAREAGLDEQELATWAQELYGKEVDQLSRRDASALIEALQRRRGEVS